MSRPRLISASRLSAILLGGFIGYGEESDTHTFVRGRLLSVGRPIERNNYGRTYTGVPMRLSYTLDDPVSDAPEQIRFEDMLWLERFDGSWRIAKESVALYRAWAAYQIPDDVLSPPDPLAARHAREAAARKRAEEESEYRRSFVTAARQPATCATTVSFDDPDADVLTYDVGSPPTRASDQRAHAEIDVTRALVDVDARRACATFRFAKRVKPPLRVVLSLGDTASLFKCCASYELLWLAPGQVRFGAPASAEGSSPRQLRLIPIEGARIFLGERSVSLAIPLPTELPFPAASIGWRATAGRGATPGFADWIPGHREPYELFVRIRDGRVVQPQR